MHYMKHDLGQITQWLGTGSINVFGMPLAGKDTQCTTLAELFGGVVISSGDVLRHDHGNAEIQRIMAEGGIVPSALFAQVVTPYLSREEFSGKPLFLSEVGRIQGEETMVAAATTESGHPLKAVVLLRISHEVALKRFDLAKVTHDRGERADDVRDVLQKRFAAYEAMVTPVIEYYRGKDLLIELDATPAPEVVTQEVLERLSEFAART